MAAASSCVCYGAPSRRRARFISSCGFAAASSELLLLTAAVHSRPAACQPLIARRSVGHHGPKERWAMLVAVGGAARLRAGAVWCTCVVCETRCYVVVRDAMSLCVVRPCRWRSAAGGARGAETLGEQKYKTRSNAVYNTCASRTPERHRAGLGARAATAPGARGDGTWSGAWRPAAVHVCIQHRMRRMCAAVARRAAQFARAESASSVTHSSDPASRQDHRRQPLSLT